MAPLHAPWSKGSLADLVKTIWVWEVREAWRVGGRGVGLILILMLSIIKPMSLVCMDCAQEVGNPCEVRLCKKRRPQQFAHLVQLLFTPEAMDDIFFQNLSWPSSSRTLGCGVQVAGRCRGDTSDSHLHRFPKHWAHWPMPRPGYLSTFQVQLWTRLEKTFYFDVTA